MGLSIIVIALGMLYLIVHGFGCMVTHLPSQN